MKPATSKLLRHRFDARERIGIGGVQSVKGKRGHVPEQAAIYGPLSLWRAISLIIWTGPDPPNRTRRAGAATGTSEGGADRPSAIARSAAVMRNIATLG